MTQAIHCPLQDFCVGNINVAEDELSEIGNYS